MTRISNQRLKPKLQNQMFYLFWKFLADLKSPKDLEFFTARLFSPAEKVMLAKRFMIALLLEQGLSFRRVCQVLKVSPNTVSSVVRSSRRRTLSEKRLLSSFLKTSLTSKILASV